jgi:hypothetical protein
LFVEMEFTMATDASPFSAADPPAARRASASLDQPATPRTATSANSPDRMTLRLDIEDREVIEALKRHEHPAQRQQFALAALKVGVAALQVASGRLDADLLQRESANLLQAVNQQLRQHTEHVHDRVNSQLKEYFDPESGRFNERVKRLVSRDGELEQLLRRQVGAEDSELAKTLMVHFGQSSQLMKLLSPTESEGLVAALRAVVEDQLRQQRERVLQEFSLDNAQSALSRLVGEITRNHGQLQENLQAKLDGVVKEFSLDQENSALSRLVRNVDTAQRTIVREFSLDNPESALSRLNDMLRDTQGTIHGHLTLDDENAPLARLKRELLQLLKEHSRENVEFREEIKSTLAQLIARREAVAGTTQHGLEFEEVLGQFLARHRDANGDILSPTGARVGAIKNCKIGDFVIELSQDCQAAGARIVVEAKEDAAYNVSKALAEIQAARKNREAQFGIFVLSARCAPTDMEPFARYGDDILVVWNPDDPTSDVYMQAALTTARALCVRSTESAANEADFQAINRAILEIEKRAASLDDIRKSAETIQSASQRILDRVQMTRQALERQVATLGEKVRDWIHHATE